MTAHNRCAAAFLLRRRHQRQNLHRILRPQAPAGTTRASHRRYPQSMSLVFQRWLPPVAHKFLFCRIWNSRTKELVKYLAIARARRHPAAKTILPSESAVTMSTGRPHPKPRFQRYHERRIHCIRPTRLGAVKLNVNTYTSQSNSVVKNRRIIQYALLLVLLHTCFPGIL